MKRLVCLGFLLYAGFTEAVCTASVPALENTDHEAMLSSADPQLRANKRVVYDMWRFLLDAKNTTAAAPYIAEGYIQHNPVVASGRAAILAAIDAGAFGPPQPMQARVAVALTAILAEKDLVVLVQTISEDSGAAKYTTGFFDMYRVADGRVTEHWDFWPVPPGMNQTANYTPTAVNPYYAASLQSSDAVLAYNKARVYNLQRIVNDASQASAVRSYVADPYLEHSPHSGSGVGAVEARAAQTGGSSVRPAVENFVDMVAEGDLVLLATVLTLQDASGTDYAITWFDMYRVRNGMAVEHWDGAKLAENGTTTQDLAAVQDCTLPPHVPGPAWPVENTDHEALLAHADAKLAANKRVVYDLWRALIAGDAQAATEYLAESFIQHSPGMDTGRAALLDAFSSAGPAQPIQDRVPVPLVAIVAEGDLVVFVLVSEFPGPANETYSSTWFDMYRVQDGVVTEHWDHGTLSEGVPAGYIPPVARADQAAALESTEPTLASNKKFVSGMFRTLIDARQVDDVERFIAEDYIEHTVLVAGGRAGVVDRISIRGAPRAVQPEIPNLVEIVAEGDLVVAATLVGYLDANNETYLTTWFDMYRVSGELATEHWDVEVIGAQVPSVPEIQRKSEGAASSLDGMSAVAVLGTVLLLVLV